MMSKLASVLAVLRILAGSAFIFSGVTKLLDDSFLYGGLMHRIYELGTPFPIYQKFLLRFVELHQTAFAAASAAGEITVGLSLVLGLLVSWGTLGGIFLVANFALATCAGSPARLAIHGGVALLLLLLGRMGAGLKWGLDGWLIRHVKDWLVLFPLRLQAPSME